MSDPTTVTTNDGVELNVVSDGDPGDPPLLLVNGAYCAVPVWDNVIAELAREFRVIRHDVRGTGRSTAGTPNACAFERYGADLVTIADAFEIDRFHLWGMAWGARVALVTAALNPDRVDRLVVSDFAIDPADPDAQRRGAKEAAAARASAGIAEPPKPAGWNDHDDPESATLTIEATRLHHDLMPFVQATYARTLILTGDLDPNLASSRRALPGFADADLEVIPHTGHGIVRQRPDVATERVLAFLR